MLVALPSAIAFGASVYAPLGSSFLAQGALAGVLGAVALGLVAPVLGGTRRLISAPCAPAAAVLGAFALERLHAGGSPADTVLLMTLLALAAGLMQAVFGVLRLGQLIVYMPYPVVSGYLSGVGLYVIAGQLPRLLGVTHPTGFWDTLTQVGAWQWQGLSVGLVSAVTMVVAPRITQRVPAAILGLLSGIVAYFGLALLDPSLWRVAHNPLLIGPLGGSSAGLADAMTGRWQALGGLGLEPWLALLLPALTLAALLSIDTLKTCLVLDAMTRSRHDSNRELVGQGLGNMAAALCGGMPGAGTLGATLVNLSSGARTRWSGVMEGGLALAAFGLLGSLIAWVPVASLAAILIVVGVRMLDRHSLTLLRQRATLLDALVIAAVIVTALTVSLIAASAVGIVLAVLLFVREEIGGTVVRRTLGGHETFSKRVRTAQEMAILTAPVSRAVVVELQGSLFFGTADQLRRALEPELKVRDFVVLDLRRVHSIDVTAAHLLDQIRDTLAERGGYLLLSQLPPRLPSGRDMAQYFDQVGLVRPDTPVRVFAELDDALEWVEDRVLADAGLQGGEEAVLGLHEVEFFRDRKPETLQDLDRCVEKRHYPAGTSIFRRDDAGDELFIIRRGLVRIMLPITDSRSHHLATFGRGAFFGEMSFLDGDLRSADAVAHTDIDVFVLSRRVFEQLAEDHRKLALGLMGGLASALAARLRFSNTELRGLES
jgi:sulfate permease, SulP family